MILLLIMYKYVYCLYLLHEEPCNVDVANKPLLLLLLLALCVHLLKCSLGSVVFQRSRKFQHSKVSLPRNYYVPRTSINDFLPQNQKVCENG